MNEPTHKLKVLNKKTQRFTVAGAGWLKPDGRISIALNPCIVLSPDEDLVITLFPVKDADESFGE